MPAVDTYLELIFDNLAGAKAEIDALLTSQGRAVLTAFHEEVPDPIIEADLPYCWVDLPEEKVGDDQSTELATQEDTVTVEVGVVVGAQGGAAGGRKAEIAGILPCVQAGIEATLLDGTNPYRWAQGRVWAGKRVRGKPRVYLIEYKFEVDRAIGALS